MDRFLLCAKGSVRDCPHCWGLGGDPSVCVLSVSRGTQADRSLTRAVKVAVTIRKVASEKGGEPISTLESGFQVCRALLQFICGLLGGLKNCFL